MHQMVPFVVLARQERSRPARTGYSDLRRSLSRPCVMDGSHCAGHTGGIDKSKEGQRRCDGGRSAVSQAHEVPREIERGEKKKKKGNNFK